MQCSDERLHFLTALFVLGRRRIPKATFRPKVFASSYYYGKSAATQVRKEPSPSGTLRTCRAMMFGVD